MGKADILHHSSSAYICFIIPLAIADYIIKKEIQVNPWKRKRAINKRLLAVIQGL